MFRRGFKAWCERYAESTRSELGIKAHEPLDPQLLASKLGILVWGPENIPGLSQTYIDILLRNDGVSASDWSAVTIEIETQKLVILNTSHSIGRQSSDLMHELSHIILEHKSHSADSSLDGILLLSAYDKDHEDEADWLSSCLLLPRAALISIKRQNIEIADAAELFKVSVRMLRYRMSMTGVSRQFS